MAISDQEFARIRNKVFSLSSGGGGGISSVNLYVSGSDTVLTGDSFYVSGADGIILTSSNSPNNVLIISASAPPAPAQDVILATQAYTKIEDPYYVVAGNTIDGSDYTGNQLSFKVVGYADAGSTLRAILYNLTQGTTVSTIDISSTSPTGSLSTISLPSTNKMYEVRIKKVGGASTNYVYLFNAFLRVE